MMLFLTPRQRMIHALEHQDKSTWPSIHEQDPSQHLYVYVLRTAKHRDLLNNKERYELAMADPEAAVYLCQHPEIRQGFSGSYLHNLGIQDTRAAAALMGNAADRRLLGTIPCYALYDSIKRKKPSDLPPDAGGQSVVGREFISLVEWTFKPLPTPTPQFPPADVIAEKGSVTTLPLPETTRLIHESVMTSLPPLPELDDTDSTCCTPCRPPCCTLM